MPLTRYVIRNEFSLADPELYRAANKDDPEALLEGVAMAGLVGVLRQLGDLAEFAAEIFHDLHEEVMATAARGHGLIVRVQQLEAEFPSIEKAILSQTNHSLFFSNAGIDWHPNIRTEHNLVTSEDLPRFVMDSYEECRGPPRLFLLDKFDVAGAGACLKRYTDPSFFKAEPGSSGIATFEVHREKKIRKVKKKGSRWRNGETPEIVPSHAKLHELFLEERIESGFSDPARLVKLKKRQLNSSSHDSEKGKSYMEKFMETPSEHEVIREISVAPLPLRLISENKSESGLEIVEIGMVSPVKKPPEEKNNARSSPNMQVSVLQQSMDELNDEDIDEQSLEVPEPTSDDESLEICSSSTKVVDKKELTIDGESKTGGNVNGYPSDDITSDVDNYMDALTTMESEMETDNESKSKNDVGFLTVEHEIGYVANEEPLQLQAHLSDSQSTGNSSASDGGNSSFKNDRSSFSYSDTISNVAENMPSDGDEAAEVFPSAETRVLEIVDASSDQLSKNAQILGTNAGELVKPYDRCIEEGVIPDLGKESCSSCLTDSNPALLPLDSVADLLENSLVESKSGDGPSVDELDDGGPYIGCEASQHLSNASELAPKKIGDYTSANKVLQTEHADENCAQTLISGEDGSLHSVNSLAEEHLLYSALPAIEACSDITSLPDSFPTSHTHKSDFVNSNGKATKVNDAIPAIRISSENSSPMAQTHSILGSRSSSMISDGPQLELDLSEMSVPDIAEKLVLEDMPISADGEEIDGFISNVGGGVDAPVEHSSNYEIDPDHVEHVTVIDTVSESVQEKDMAFATPNGPSPPDISYFPSDNLLNLQKSLPGFDIPHQRGLEFNGATSTECLSESETQNAVDQIGVTPPDHSSLEINDDVHDLSWAEQSQNSDGTTALKSSEFNNQESESISHCSNMLENNEGDLSKFQGGKLDEEHLQADEQFYKSSDQFEHTQSSNHMDREFDASKSCSEELPDKSPWSVFLPQSASQELDGTKHNTFPLSSVSSSFDHPVETQFDHASSESCSKDLVSQSSSSEILPQSAGEELGCTKEALDSLDFSLPGFGLVPEETQVNLEEMPPLPPLPPVQWRIGKVQHGPSDLQRVSECNEDSLPPIQPFTADDSSRDSEILQQKNPFLISSAVNDDKSQLVSDHSVVMPEPHSLPMQTIANDTNDRHDIPFSKLPVTPNESPEFCFPPARVEIVQSSSNPFEPVATIVDAAAGTDSASSEVKLIQPLQVAPETGLEVKTHQHTTKSLEEQQVNSLETVSPPPTLEDNQPEHNLLPSSSQEITSSSNSSELLIGEPNKNAAIKIPRPPSPLIQAVAAHDKSTLRKVTERVRPQIPPKVEERDSLLEQIRTKSFNLKPALLSRPSIQGPKTNLKVAAILEKANAIRQACVGSDEDDDEERWSDS